MKTTAIEKAENFAKALDWLRVMPRLLIGGYGYLVYLSSVWFMTLADPTVAQSSYVALIYGASAAWFGLYVNSGKKW